MHMLFSVHARGLRNASFGAEDSLQLLQTVADGLRYESASISELPELVAN